MIEGLSLDTVHLGDALKLLRKIPSNSIDSCVTSPPYYGLRDYNDPEQIGLEPTLAEYISALVAVFAEVHRVLKPEGTFWLVIGDSYAGSHKGQSNKGANDPKNAKVHGMQLKRSKPGPGIKDKDLIGVPWAVAFALRDWGWYLRQRIVWAKPNPMPESVKDRCTASVEDIFMFTKQAKYYYDADAIKEPAVSQHPAGIGYKRKSRETFKNYNGTDRGDIRGWEVTDSRNCRNVWTVATKAFKGAHFAVFPDKLVVRCILAGCPPGGVVLDPFGGSGTTGVVALRLNRRFILFELNPAYKAIADTELAPYLYQRVLV